MPRTSEALTGNGPVSECPPAYKFGTIIIQTVHILQYDRAVTGSLPEGYQFRMRIPTYFQII